MRGISLLADTALEGALLRNIDELSAEVVRVETAVKLIIFRAAGCSSKNMF